MANPWDFNSGDVWYERSQCNDYPTFEPCKMTCSANPIWCMHDLLTNKRYGLGKYMKETDFDRDQLISDAAYCDEQVDDGKGGTEERHRLDVVIDSRVKAMDLISQLVSSFRGLPFFSAGRVYVKIDRIQTFPTQIFGMGNILKDSFGQRWKSDKERFNMVEVQFLDKEKDYAQETIVVTDEEAFEVRHEDQKPHQLRLFVTRVSEAIREGRYAIKVSKHIEKTVTLKSQLNAIVCQPGDRVDLSHDVPRVGASGTLKEGCTTTLLKLDREVTILADTTYKVKVVFMIDDSIEEVEVTNGPGTYTELTVLELPKTPQAFDKYVFGIENILTEPLRVVSIERDSADNVSIGCVQYKPEVYIDDILILPETKYSTLDTGFPKVTNLVLQEAILKSEEGVLANYIDVSFVKPSLVNNPLNSYKSAKIYLSDNNGLSYTLAGETTGESFRIETGVLPNRTYRVTVVVVNTHNVEGSKTTAATATITTHTNILYDVNLWELNREYILTNMDRIQSALFNRGYARDAFALMTSNKWRSLEGQDWDGLDLDNQVVAASGSIEMAVALNLGMKSKYVFSPVLAFKNYAGGSAKVQIATSLDNVTFDAYVDINPATEYITQYVKFKTIVETSDTDEQVQLYSGTIGVDSPRVLT